MLICLVDVLSYFCVAVELECDARHSRGCVIISPETVHETGLQLCGAEVFYMLSFIGVLLFMQNGVGKIIIYAIRDIYFIMNSLGLLTC